MTQPLPTLKCSSQVRVALILMIGKEGQGDRGRGFPGSLPERLWVREGYSVQKEWPEQNLGG